MTPLLVVSLLSVAVGVSLVLTYLPVFRRPSLDSRVVPYLGLVTRPSRLLSSQSSVTPWPTVERLIRPLLTAAAHKIDRVLGGTSSVRSRLDRMNSDSSVERFRLEQLLWGLGALLASTLLLGARHAGGASADPVLVLLLTVLAFVAGVLLRDRMLTVAVKRRLTEMEAEFPTVVELLALAVGAGEGVVSALERVSRVGHGPLVGELERALSELRAGASLVDALIRLAQRVDVPEVRRFVDALVVALERGTPMASVLSAQAADARESQRRELIESGGRKEIAMMVPVVFLVLPLSVIFALFPGFYGLSLGTS